MKKNYNDLIHERCGAVVDLSAVRHNISELKRCHDVNVSGSLTGETTGSPTVEPTGSPTGEPTAESTGDLTGEPTGGRRKDCLVLASVKADAYGHGAVRVAQAIEEQVDYFAVACTAEGLELRENGIKSRILVLGPVFDTDFEAAVENDITLTVFDAESGCLLEKTARRLGRTAHIHLAVDTGMSRIGVMPDEAGLSVLEKLISLDHISVDGVFTHFATADEADKTEAGKALDRFNGFRRLAKARGISVPLWHCANTAAVIDGIGAGDGFGMIRCGIGLYGLYPSAEVKRENADLRPALKWRSFLTYVKTIRKGTSVSYGCRFTADRDMVIGTVCCGYADGYPRIMSGQGGEVLIRGKRCRILGSICMDQFMVDLSGVPDAVKGDEAVLIGTQESPDGCFSDSITAEEIAEKCGTISYEIICGIKQRVRRVYIDTDCEAVSS